MELGVSYIPAHLPAHITADMRHLQGIGCTHVLFALQENHFEYLTGAVRFGAVIAADHGLTPYLTVWGLANTFGGGRISLLLLKEPDLWRVRRDGTREPHACLNHPQFPRRFGEFIAQARRRGYRGVLIDEPTTQDCYCRFCRARFATQFGKDLHTAKRTDAYRLFQQETVLNYVRTAGRAIKRVDRSLRTLVCIMPHDRALFEPVARIRELDVLGTDPYWLLLPDSLTLAKGIADTQALRQVCAAHGKRSQVWLNCWGIPAGKEAAILAGGRRLAAVGCDSFFTWSFRGGLGTNEACADPARAWQSVVRLYRELAGRR